jgi:serine/threonine-protein kinase
MDDPHGEFPLNQPLLVRTNSTPKIVHPGLLIVGRALWGMVFFTSLFTFTASLPALWEQFRAPAPDVAAGLAQLGLSADVFALVKVGAQAVASLAFFALSVFMVLRLSRQRIGLMTAIFFAALGTPLGGGAPTVSIPVGGLFLPTAMYILGWSSVWLFAATFPDGRFLPRWAVIPALLGIFTLPFWLLPPTSPLLVYNWPSVLQILLMVTTYGSTIYARIYRYRHFSSPIQRQQSKWVILIFAQIGLFSIINHLLPSLFPAMHQPGVPAVIRDVLQTLPTLASALAPIALMFAIVRYRLWDVDLLINRSLVYGAATLLLVLVFAIGTVIIGGIVGDSDSAIALPISAVAVGLLFNPTRKLTQRFIDRRFYHFRHDLNELADAQKKPEIKNPGWLTGKMLGDYEVLGLLGKGGMGEVYKGYAAGQTVAIKILPTSLADEPTLISRFDHEAKAMQRLIHPNIVKLLSTGTQESLHYIVLEYIDGVDLSDFLKQRGVISLTEAQVILQPLAHALDYAHSLGIIHRDIKPSNVMLRHGSPSEVVLMDFGLAKLKDSGTRLTESGAIGTIDYMAPEQIMAAKAVDHRADIYALGVLTYEMLTAEAPFQGNVGQVVFAHLQQPPPNPCWLKPELPSAVGEAIQQAMAKEPRERFASADEFFQALSRVAETELAIL